MKALIISEDQQVCDSLNTVLVKAGYDTIIYKWLLKALDNIEEIRPNCIVVSSSEYPRHWKTLVQFVKSGIGGDDVAIYLYEPKPLSKEDEEKARILGITDYFTSLEAEVLQKIFCKLEPEAEVSEAVPAPAPADIEEDLPAVTNTGHFMFTHPVNGKFIAGKFFDYNGKTMSCSFYNQEDLASIKAGDLINSFSYFDSKSTKNAAVLAGDCMKISEDTAFIIMEVKEIHEEV